MSREQTPTTPIIAKRIPPGVSINSPGPEFAEFLTPQKLRPKGRRRHLQHGHDHDNHGVPAAMQAGPSVQGYTTVEGDLYRGAVVDPTAVRMVEDDAITIASTTSTSSSWSLGSNISRGRRATMAVIERFGEAIGVRRGSMSSDSDTSELRSVVTRGTRRRRLSTVLSRTISRGSASTAPERPKRQQLPRRREFTLVLPPSPDSDNHPSDRVITTPALPTILERIKQVRHSRGIAVESPLDVPRRPRSMPGQKRVPVFANPRPQAARAKSRVEMLRGKEEPTRPKSVSDLMGLANPYGSSTSLSSMREESPPLWKEAKQEEGCWWLDVSCPGWEDLRDIGELLGLHPLTLEDVLQQDPREKMDTFESLGYYFICARALDESYFKYTPGTSSSPPLFKRHGSSAPELPTNAPDNTTDDGHAKKDRRRAGWGLGKAADMFANQLGREKVEIIEDNPGKEGLEGVGVGAVNVYLVVFADGVVSFHFEDITKHTQRVMDRILSLVGDYQGSDWIAHGILDSIVDAFFPMIRYVDNEVEDIDHLTIDPYTDPQPTQSPIPTPQSSQTSVDVKADGIEMNEKISLDSGGMKIWKDIPPPYKPTLTQRLRQHLNSIPSGRIRVPRFLIYIKLFWVPLANGNNTRPHTDRPHAFGRYEMIKRITDTRKLVTGLSRLLHGKHNVVGRMRKRARMLDLEGVEAYIGDLEDHILLLEKSLNHQEYVLAHCQPAYLSHLNVTIGYFRAQRDRILLGLTTVTIAVFSMQLCSGLFSMNVRIPHQGAQDAIGFEPIPGVDSPYWYFIMVICFMLFFATLVVSLVRYLRWRARQKMDIKRGHPQVDAWDAYWGWK